MLVGWLVGRVSCWVTYYYIFYCTFLILFHIYPMSNASFDALDKIAVLYNSCYKGV